MSLLVIGCASQQEDRYAQNLTTRARAHTDLGAAYFQQNRLVCQRNLFFQPVVFEPKDPHYRLKPLCNRYGVDCPGFPGGRNHIPAQSRC